MDDKDTYIYIFVRRRRRRQKLDIFQNDSLLDFPVRVHTITITRCCAASDTSDVRRTPSVFSARRLRFRVRRHASEILVVVRAGDRRERADKTP